MEDVDRTFILTTDALVERFKAFLGHQTLPVRVVVSKVLERRSIEQNARLWALHGLAANHLGYTPGQMHELSLCRYFGVKEIKIGMITMTVPFRRSSMRNKKEFNDYMGSTEMWYAGEFGIWLE